MRARKRHVQGELVYWGGPRQGASRPKNGVRASERHRKRPVVKASVPQHVVMRVASRVGSLRRRDVYQAIRLATIVVAGREGVRFVQVSIQRSHIHLLVEADNRVALAKGMQCFGMSAARHINRTLRGRGCVFADRYHATPLPTPRQVRNCLEYVLNNWRKHGDDRQPEARGWKLDAFATGLGFDGWRDSTPGFAIAPDARVLVVRPARTRLMTDGWRRYGLLDPLAVPGGGTE